MAKVSVQSLLLEQQITGLQGQITNLHATNDTRVKFDIVKGEHGTCKRCEAFVIANGVTIQKLKTLRAENNKLKSKI